MGAKDLQTLKAIEEAAAYDGPSIIIAYSHCIEHGYDMMDGATQQDKAVNREEEMTTHQGELLI